MKRRLLVALSAVSLLLSLVVIFVWIRSHWVQSQWGYLTASIPRARWAQYGSSSARGRFCFLYVTTQYANPADIADVTQNGQLGFYYEVTNVDHDNFDLPTETFWNRRGFALQFQEIQKKDVRQTDRLTWAMIPDWLVILILLLLSLPGLLHFSRTRRHHRLGLCPACGYDLRATPDRCPECGTVPTNPAEAEA